MCYRMIWVMFWGWKAKSKHCLYWTPLRSCLWQQGTEFSDGPFQISVSCPKFLCFPVPLWGTSSLHIPLQSTHCHQRVFAGSLPGLSLMHLAPRERGGPTHNNPCWELGSPATFRAAEQPQFCGFPFNWYFLCHMDKKISAKKTIRHWQKGNSAGSI